MAPGLLADPRTSTLNSADGSFGESSENLAPINNAETILTSQCGIRQAKIIDRASSRSLPPQWTAVISLDRLTETHPSDSATAIKSARKALLKCQRKAQPGTLLVPKHWLVLEHLPEDDCGSVDEAALQRLLDGPSRSESINLAKENAMKLMNGSKELNSQHRIKDVVLPQAMTEILKILWAPVLGLRPTDIAENDSFLQLGGDSISAIELVAIAADCGIQLTVGSIFATPRLAQMATVAVVGAKSSTDDTVPFSLFPTEAVYDILKTAAASCNLSTNQIIEDALPCTPLQEGLIALAFKDPGSYIARQVYKMPQNINIQRFQKAWERTVEMCPVMRTRIIQFRDRFIQVVVKGPAQWEAESKETVGVHSEHLSSMSVHYGIPLCRYSLVRDEASDQIHFIWAMHHAIFDGWSIKLTLDLLSRVYHAEDHIEHALSDPSSFDSFSTFVNHTQMLDKGKAVAYWREELDGARCALFPQSSEALSPNPVSQRTTDSTQSFKSTFSFHGHQHEGVTKATVLRAAWAIILAKYSDTDDICFGTSISGRQTATPYFTASKVVGPTVATIPVRVRIDSSESTKNFLHRIQSHAHETTEFDQFGLRNIAQVSADAKDACEFASLFVVQPPNNDREGILRRVFLVNDVVQSHFNYPLVIQVHILQDDRMELEFTYKPAILAENQINGLAEQFKHVTQQLIAESDLQVGEISVAGPWDLQQATTWNKRVEYDVFDACVHDLFSLQVFRTPDNDAVYSSEGCMTYQQLDSLTTSLALFLSQELQVGPEVIVPICFEKSPMALVAMLGIMKAGGVFMPLDPSHPLARRQALVRDAGCQMMLVSSSQAQTSQDVTDNTITLTNEFLYQLQERQCKFTDLPKTTPDNAVHIVFTSGSTGHPKGIVALHSALSISLVAQAKSFAVNENTRFLQFASYVFDISITEMFCTLISGGTVCIPSEKERIDGLVSFITESRANLAFITPTLARTINPDDVPTLKALIVAGEPSGRDVQELWCDRVSLMNSYGPAEVSVCCCQSPVRLVDDSPANIGLPFNCKWWVVDPENHNQLAAIGCVGELVLHGLVVARGYLNNERATKDAFLESTSWYSKQSGDRARFYKTGDLVRYKHDGSLQIMGRKDRQVKVRGRRVELGEIEAALQLAVLNARHITVELVPLKSRATLVAFICIAEEQRQTSHHNSSLLLTMTPEWEQVLFRTELALRETLPSYMIPSIFLPLGNFPFLISMKVDRKQLRLLVESMSSNELALYSLAKQEKVAPQDESEIMMQEVWAKALNLNLEDIGRNDNFFQLGGDSVSAMEVVSLAERKAMNLTVAEVFETPQLFRLAAKSRNRHQERQHYHTVPFELLGTADVGHIKEEVKRQCAISETAIIEDIFPCTPMQEGLMALGVTRPGSYVVKRLFKIPDKISIDRFKDSWERTVTHCSNLRTRIVLLGNVAVQAILNCSSWDQYDCSTPQEVLEMMGSLKMSYGSPLCRYAFIQHNEESYFAWTIHHSIYDGLSLKLVFETFDQFYSGQTPDKLPSFATFLKYTASFDIADIRAYWQKYLQGASKAVLPFQEDKSAVTTTQSRHRLLKKTMALKLNGEASFTKAALIRSTWALVLARYCATDDICFGITVSGRQAPVSDIHKKPGPMITTVPARVKIDKKQKVADFLGMVQSEASNSVAYEQLGLQNIAQLSSDARAACDFTNLLVIQHAGMTPVVNSREKFPFGDSSERLTNEVTEQNFFNYPLVLQVFLFDEELELLFSYDSSAFSHEQIKAMSEHFDTVAQSLVSQTDSILADISLIGPWDRQHAVSSHRLKEVTKLCTHWAIQSQVHRRPDDPAVVSWDLNLTYRDLNRFASQVAFHLQRHGVGPGVLVTLCFPKSAWAIVAMVAVQIAGGGFVSLDPNAPLSRLQDIVKSTGSSLILIGESCRGIFDKTSIQTLVLSEGEIEQMVVPSSPITTTATPDDTSFVIFTSGSSGTPKGIFIPHSSICSSSEGYGAQMGVGPGTRVFQYSAYTFDVAVLDILVSLMRGACVCVPSDHDRLDNLGPAINRMDANWVFLTPTVANILDPQDVPNLKVICLGGEAANDIVVDKWREHVELHGLYGPAEASICSWNPNLGKYGRAVNIGVPVSSAFWVVQPTDHTELVPVGCIGELVIQGPLLGRGYLNADEVTSANWLSDVSCFPEVSWPTAYKTGDLVRRNADGTFDYMGRKDAQIKIHGQRMEPGEIEHHIRSIESCVNDVVVDALHRDSTSSLVAFLTIHGEEQLQRSRLATRLADILPSSMIPSYFIVVEKMPLTVSGKLDRKALRDKIANMSPNEMFASQAAHQSTFRECTSEIEMAVRDIWSGILDIPANSISADDNFYHIGGNSIRIVTLAHFLSRDFGVSLGLSLINSKRTTVSGIAEAISNLQGQNTLEEPESIDLMGELQIYSNQEWDIRGLLANPITTLPSEATVFLTGATGYLGTEILRQLLNSKFISTIAVLVRATSQRHGMDRIKATATAAGWWQPTYEKQIDIWIGDLAKSGFGLRQNQLQRLHGQSDNNDNINAIIHNGAVVNWNADYEKLRAANVESTVQLLKATASSAVSPKFVFVSGGTKNEDGVGLAEFIVELNSHIGYTRTKFVAETVVDDIVSRLPVGQNRISVVKPGLIIGGADKGVANLDDFLWRIVATTATLKAWPSDASVITGSWVYLAEVDYIAGILIDQITTSSSIRRFIDMREGMGMTQFMNLVNDELDEPGIPISREEWVRRAKAEIEKVGEEHPLWAVSHFLYQLNVVVKKQDGYKSTPRLCDAVGKNVRYLKEVGFIGTGGNHVKSGEIASLIKRTDMAAVERMD